MLRLNWDRESLRTYRLVFKGYWGILPCLLSIGSLLIGYEAALHAPWVCYLAMAGLHILWIALLGFFGESCAR